MSNSEPGARMGRRGKLVVISGPSGTGKTSITKALLERLPEAVWSVSVTTRPPRTGETDGQSYEFISEEEFESREAAGELLESAEYVGHRYGTPRRPIEEALTRGQHVIMEIDVQGGAQVGERMPESIRIFVLPPDRKTLRDRLAGRRTETEEQLEKRLAEVDREIASARESGCYQHFVVNDVLETAIEDVQRIIEQENEGP